MWKPLLSLSLLILSSCGVKIKDVKACAVSGVLSQGADCVTSLSGKHEELNLDQFIDFLEPQPEKINPDGSKIPERGAAVCLSAEDWIALKTAIQQLCEKVGSFCTKEVKQEIAQVNSNVDDLQKRVMRKKKAVKPKGA